MEPGHAAKLSTTKSTPTNYMTYYIPHHYVTNKQSKFGVIFDTSAKFAGTSLNNYLLKGLDPLNGIVTVLLRFRNRKYSISADIEKTFHQIFVKQNERNYLRFLWRDKPSLAIDEYQMNIYLRQKRLTLHCKFFSKAMCKRSTK